MLNIIDDYVNFSNSTQFRDGEIDKISIKPKLSLPSIPSGVLLVYLIRFIIWTTLNPLFSKEVRVLQHYNLSGSFDTQKNVRVLIPF